MEDLTGAARAFCLPFYAEPHRAYHTLNHVQAMLEALGDRGVLSPTLALAVWGHDLIYDSQASDNEARSAEVFGTWLDGQGAAPELVQEVRRLILETRHTAPPTDRAAALLIDADLGAFGADDATFWDYERAIRQEYSSVPWPQYQEGRRRMLDSFLTRERIYTTPEFSGLEAQARQHLEAAREVLDRADTEDAALAAWNARP